MKTHHALLTASCRVALAGLLHDLGKFAERAALPLDPEILNANLAQYARSQQQGKRHWYSHRHAAYTAIAIDLLEQQFPRLIGEDMHPFAGWNSPEVDDSLINAAARHHRPETLLQWILATADRVASGFERQTFDQYNDAKENTSTRKNHITARQLTLFEQIAPPKQTQLHYRYALQPLSPESLFPVKAEQIESNNKTKAQQDYRQLWDSFVAALKQIPASHQDQLALWLDHFETLLLTFTQAIPSATAFGVKPEVSLYDHSKAVAALAVALWRYHDAQQDDPATVTQALRTRADWDEPKFLLIQADLFGIQDFIFASGGETQKRASRLLRGRSFYVSLLTECAALKILDSLALPSTSQIINAAGKFLLVAPNTSETKAALKQIQQALDQWFLTHSYGLSGVGLAWLEASCNDFLSDKQAGTTSRFAQLMTQLFAQLDFAKHQRFSLCDAQPAPAIQQTFLEQLDPQLGLCQIDGRSPAKRKRKLPNEEGEIRLSQLAEDQIDLGHWLTQFDRLLVSRTGIGKKTLALDLFGYRISFDDSIGHLSPEIRAGNLLRAWDFSLPTAANQTLWHGYARRAINAFIPCFTGTEAPLELEKYASTEQAETPKVNEPKTLNHLACEDRQLDQQERWFGVPALMTLKGDVDNLGLLFEQGLTQPTFAKMAAFSRQLNSFFTLYLPWLCRNAFPNTYTVFAGGDDFFLIGPWRPQIRLAQKLRQDFQSYVADNPAIHFSVGLSMTKPGLPIRHLAALGEHALDQAKSRSPAKNSVTCFGQTVHWDRFEALQQAQEALTQLSRDLTFSTGYVYGLLELINMAETVNDYPENARWHSYFAYRTRRLLEQDRRLSERERQRLFQQVSLQLAQQGIAEFQGDYRIAVLTHLYQLRH